MPVMVLKVEQSQWNRVEMAAVTFGLDMAPDAPEQGAVTTVEICGTLDKLQTVLRHIGSGPRLAAVVDRMPLFFDDDEG